MCKNQLHDWLADGKQTMTKKYLKVVYRQNRTDEVLAIVKQTQEVLAVVAPHEVLTVVQAQEVLNDERPQKS